MPSRTLFGVHNILTGVGIQTLSVLSGRLPTAEIAEWAGEDTPLFCMPSLVAKNPLAHGYQSEQHVADRCQIISQLIYLEEDLQEGFSPNHS